VLILIGIVNIKSAGTGSSFSLVEKAINSIIASS
jgi:hypothetical protein